MSPIVTWGFLSVSLSMQSRIFSDSVSQETQCFTKFSLLCCQNVGKLYSQMETHM